MAALGGIAGAREVIEISSDSDESTSSSVIEIKPPQSQAPRKAPQGKGLGRTGSIGPRINKAPGRPVSRSTANDLPVRPSSASPGRFINPFTRYLGTTSPAVPSVVPAKRKAEDVVERRLTSPPKPAHATASGPVLTTKARIDGEIARVPISNGTTPVDRAEASTAVAKTERTHADGRPHHSSGTQRQDNEAQRQPAAFPRPRGLETHGRVSLPALFNSYGVTSQDSDSDTEIQRQLPKAPSRSVHGSAGSRSQHAIPKAAAQQSPKRPVKDHSHVLRSRTTDVRNVSRPKVEAPQSRAVTPSSIDPKVGRTEPRKNASPRPVPIHGNENSSDITSPSRHVAEVENKSNTAVVNGLVEAKRLSLRAAEGEVGLLQRHDTTIVVPKSTNPRRSQTTPSKNAVPPSLVPGGLQESPRFGPAAEQSMDAFDEKIRALSQTFSKWSQPSSNTTNPPTATSPTSDKQAKLEPALARTEANLIPTSLSTDQSKPVDLSLHLNPPTRPSRPVRAKPPPATNTSTTLPAIPSLSAAFRNSSLPCVSGNRFTDAELIMIIWLKEVHDMNWPEIDAKLGRTRNCCATKYFVKKGLKQLQTRAKLRYRAVRPTLEAIVARGWDVAQTIEAFRAFLETGIVPSTVATSAPSTTSQAHIHAAARTATGLGTEVNGKGSFSTSHRRYPSEDLQPVLPAKQLLRSSRNSGQQLFASTRIQSTDTSEDVVPDEISESFRTGSKGKSNHLAVSAVTNIRPLRPYLALNQRKAAQTLVVEDELWCGTGLHVNMSAAELQAIWETTASRLSRDTASNLNEVSIADIAQMLRDTTEAQRLDIAQHAISHRRLQQRTRKSIYNFLLDAVLNAVAKQSLKLQAQPRNKRIYTSSLLQREMGSNIQRQIRDTVLDSLHTVSSYTGTSGDVQVVAWSPDDQYIAAGSIAEVDNSSMQYNRPNNLLFGDLSLERPALYEIPDHYRNREKPATGVNSRHEMHVTQDPRLFHSVNAVAFSNFERSLYLYSTGYDEYVRAYKIDEGRLRLIFEHNHYAKADLLSVCREPGIFATGAQSFDDSITIFVHNGEDIAPIETLHSEKAVTRKEKKAYPTALHFGRTPATQHHLLAGYSSTIGDNAQETYGEICLWDLENLKAPIVKLSPNSGSIYDVAWSSTDNVFAIARNANGPVTKGTRSQIFMFAASGSGGFGRASLELECPALDINELVLCPNDRRFVAAAATDGKTYIWDIRNSRQLLHSFEHGVPISNHEYERGPREKWDCGVRFCTWGHDAARLYTGSSDGVVKRWDVRCSAEDAHQADVASFDSGIMSGAFNSDFTKLLIGETKGAVHILEAGTPQRPPTDFQFIPATARHNNQESNPVEPRRQANAGLGKCTIPLCRNQTLATSEEFGDSGRSADRIPQSSAAVSEVRGMVSGMAKCTHCSQPARPRLGDPEQELFPLCERCGFSCFRCGKRIKLAPSAEVVHCKPCALRWRIGALGYELVDEAPVKAIEESLRQLHLAEEREDACGYYHTLWTDRG